ncbi:MAG TPA: DUF6238 family protein [Yinghuangia sp.]|nr:DUF6238 family protein [Yinghuangia sp.]
MTPPDPAARAFLSIATTAIDATRVLSLPDIAPEAARVALDELHALLVAAHHLLDAHAQPAAPASAAPHTLPHLLIARDRVWQAVEEVHHAYHHAPRPDGSSRNAGDVAACRRRLPEGAPELTICQRHHQATARVRRSTTPADLRTPISGSVRHPRPGAAG